MPSPNRASRYMNWLLLSINLVDTALINHCVNVSIHGSAKRIEMCHYNQKQNKPSKIDQFIFANLLRSKY